MIEIIYLLAILLITFGFGNKVLKRFKVKNSSLLEESVLSIGLGLAFVIVILFLIGMFSLFYSGVIYLLFTLLFLFSFRETKNFFKRVFNLRIKLKLGRLEVLFLIITSVYFIFNLVGALTPTTDTDGLAYHLAIPKLYLENHGFFYIPIVVSNWPLTIEMLHLASISLQNDILAKLMQFSFGILTALAVYFISRQKFGGKTAFYSSIIFYTLPIVALESGIAYIDLGWTFFTLIGLYSFLKWFYLDKKVYLLLSAVLVGIGAGSKWNGPLVIVILFFAGLYKILKERTNTKCQLGFLILFVLVASLFPSMWYLKNFLLTNNPVIPFFADVFPTHNWNVENYKVYVESVGSKDISLLRYLLTPFYITFNGLQFGELTHLGPIFIAFTPLLIAFRKVDKKILFILVFSLVYFTAWFFTSQQSRLLMILFPLLSITSAYVLIKNNFSKVVKKIFILFLLVIIILNIPFTLLYNGKGLPAVFGLETDSDYLSRILDHYPTFEYANNNLDEDTYTLFVGEVHGYYYENPYIWGCKDMQAVIDFYLDGKDFLKNLKEAGITHILVNENKQICTEAGDVLKKIKNKLEQAYVENNVFLYEVKY